MIPIDLNAKTSKSTNNFKQLLCKMINQSGGLKLEDDEPAPIPVDEEDEDEDAIEVPKSEFIDDDDNDDNNGNDINMNEEDDTKSTLLVETTQLKLGIPKDKTAPYNNEWIEVDDSNLKEVTFNDYDIIAFGIDDEPLQIIEAAYDE